MVWWRTVDYALSIYLLKYDSMKINYVLINVIEFGYIVVIITKEFQLFEWDFKDEISSRE